MRDGRPIAGLRPSQGRQDQGWGALEGQRGHRTANSEIRIRSPAGLKPPHVNVRSFEEVFAGCGALTSAFRRTGSWEVLDPVEAYPRRKAYRSDRDMLRREVVRT